MAFSGPASFLSHLLLELLHPVEGGACLEPLDLRLVEGVIESDGFLAAVAVLDHCCQGLEKDMEDKTEHDVSHLFQSSLIRCPVSVL